MRWIFLAISMTVTLAVPATAQSPVFVTGTLFGDFKQFSGDPTSNTLNGNALGGGVRLGNVVTPRWTLELGVDAGGSTEILRASPLPAVKGAVAPPLRQSRTRNRLVATSVLIGFHQKANARVEVGYLGGLALLHATRKVDTLIAGTPQANERDLVDIVPAATIGVEARVAVSKHLGVVPDVRVIAFSLSGGTASSLSGGAPGGIAIRPGVGIRWTF